MLNIGTEELKGTDELKDAAALLRDADYLPFRFDGFTEGDQLSRGASTWSSPTAFPATSRLHRRGYSPLRHRPPAPGVQELAPVEGFRLSALRSTF
jgi:hypothetical protein